LRALRVRISLTDEMKEAAERESRKREPHIKHHFDIEHYDSYSRNVVGFLGEFAGCVMLGIDWKTNIRPDYPTIDKLDARYLGKRLDFKTETIPEPPFSRVIARSIDDDEPYGRRLYHIGQETLLEKYDLIVFGAIKRVDISEMREWCAIGWIDAARIPAYPRGEIGPRGIHYPFPAFQVKTSDLKQMCYLL